MQPHKPKASTNERFAQTGGIRRFFRHTIKRTQIGLPGQLYPFRTSVGSRILKRQSARLPESWARSESNTMKQKTKLTGSIRMLMALLVVTLLGIPFSSSEAAASSDFPSGRFAIKATGHNLCVDIPYNHAKSGQNLWLWECNSTDAQTFVRRDGRIVHEASGLCLDVEGNGRVGAPVQISNCVGPKSRWNNAQAWKRHGRDLGVPGDRCLDVDGPHEAVASQKALIVNSCGWPAKNFSLKATSGGSDPQPPAGNLQARIAAVAEAEHDAWSISSTKRLSEKNPAADAKLRKYYRASNWEPWNDPKVKGDWRNKAWSGAFMSYVLREAGANNFRFNPMHGVYIMSGFTRSGYDSLDPAKTRVQVGDLVCANRGDNITYKTARGQWNYKAHCDVVVKVKGGSVEVIGGNTRDEPTGVRGNTVGRKSFKTSSSGNLSGNGWIAVVRQR